MKEQIQVKRSIQRKLLIPILGLIFGLLVILTWIQISAQKAFFEKELGRRIGLMKENLTERGKVLSDNLTRQAENHIASFNFSNLSEVIKKSVNENKELEYVILMDISGVAHIHTENPGLEQEILSEDEDKYAAKQKNSTVNDYEKNGRPIKEFIVPIQVSTAPWGMLRLGFSLEILNKEIVSSRREIVNQTKAMVIRSIATAILFIILGFVIVTYLSKRLSKPIISLTISARELAIGNFKAAKNIKVESEDEVGVLAAANL